MEIDKKTALLSGVFGGLGIICIQIFLPKNLILDVMLNIVGGVLAVAGIMYFIAGDVLFKKSDLGFDKDIAKRLKLGLITQDQAFEESKTKIQNQLELEKQKLALETQKYILEAEKAKIKALKKPVDYGAIVGKDDKSKMPDVLGNLGGIIGGNGNQPQGKSQPKQKDTLGELYNVVEGNKNNYQPYKEDYYGRKQVPIGKLADDFKPAFNQSYPQQVLPQKDKIKAKTLAQHNEDMLNVIKGN
jgi:hypothetical protein